MRWLHVLLSAAGYGVAMDADRALVPFIYHTFPLGHITAEGWLRHEMRAEADGLAGHLLDFWNMVRHSNWLGGADEYSKLNEAFPYWLNGLVPLAYGLNDTRLKAQVHGATDYVLKNMVQDDGWVGPEHGPERLHWARSLLFLAWTDLADANSTYTTPIVDAMYRYSTLLLTMLRNNGTGTVQQAADIDLMDPAYYFWGQSRVHEMMISLQWLYEHHPRGKSFELLEGMRLLHHYGYRWEEWYVQGVYPTKDLGEYPDSFTDDKFSFLHGVNVAESLKWAAVLRRHTHNESLVRVAHDAIDWTFEYHGSVYGSIIADERLDGLSPWQGTELCTAVEVIASQAYNYRALGRSGDADSAEFAAFNALPGAMTEDWWSHQYVSTANQPFSKNLSSSPFFDVNTMGQTFGLEPNYPCCTANHPQGLPRLLQSSFLRVGTSGIIHALLGPARLQTIINGRTVDIRCQTNYPFEHILRYDIISDVSFDFHVRVPAWAGSAILQDREGRRARSLKDKRHLFKIDAGTTSLTYSLEAPIRVQHRANDSVAIYHGALLYAFPVRATTSFSGPHHYRNFTLYPSNYAPPQARDYTMINATAWNLAIDPATLQYHDRLSESQHTQSLQQELPRPIFAHGAPPNRISVDACLIDWPLIYNGSIPGPPPIGKLRRCISNTFKAELVPYGSAKLHMAELPIVDLSQHEKYEI